MQVRVELSSRRGERYHMQNQRKQRLRRLSWIVGDRWGRSIIAITKSCLSWATSSWTTTMPHLSFFFPVQSRSRLLSVTNTKEFVISALAFWRRAEPHQHPGILWMAMAFFLTQVCFKSMLRLVWVALILILLLLNSRVPLSAASISAPQITLTLTLMSVSVWVDTQKNFPLRGGFLSYLLVLTSVSALRVHSAWPSRPDAIKYIPWHTQ